LSGDADKRKGFFAFIFGAGEGYMCISTIRISDRKFQDKFFEYPGELDQATQYINDHVDQHELYFCPTLLTEERRKKEYIPTATVAWSDLDDCDPADLLVPPTILLSTSEGRTQAFWRLKEAVNSEDVEKLNQRIAYYHAGAGADTSGWDLTQLLRIPLTYNHKYVRSSGTIQTVMVMKASPDMTYTLDQFRRYPDVEKSKAEGALPFPEKLPEEPPLDILDRYRVHLNPRALNLFEYEPTSDWSKALWEFNCSLFEVGMKPEEAFVVAKAAACNKYARDGKPDSFLWKDLSRAYWHVENRHSEITPTERHAVTADFPILSDEERSAIAARPDIVQEYIDWAKTIGDAAWQYHQAGAFITLSTLLTGAVRLPTSFGIMLPNLWFMILADTTLTRKSTAMDIAMDLVVDVDPDAILATDGSIEGLLTSLSMRPGRPSVFLRDEFTGLMEMLTKRDYYAGMLETLTKLYDGKYQKRVLRKETLEVKEPVLILFAGGIKEKMLGLLQHEHVTSGFIPRFIFIAAESDVSRLKPLGPPSEDTSIGRDKLLVKLRAMREHYWGAPVTEDGRVTMPKKFDAKLTDDAWVRYNKAEAMMLEAAMQSPIKALLTPTFDRLSKSALKAATLLAASRKLEDQVIVEEEDIVRAFFYVEQWREHTLEVVTKLGQSSIERHVQKVFKAIQTNPGVLRSTIMQYYHLDARTAEQILTTLDQRGMIIRKREGRSERLRPTVEVVV
jgi:hypothetical protein